MQRVLLLLLLLPATTFGQVVPGIGAKFLYIKSPNPDYSQNYYQQPIGWYNRSNETTDYYTVHTTLSSPGVGFNLRGYGGQFLDSSRFNFGYSLDIGITQFQSKSYLVYFGSSTADPDSIVNDHDGMKYTTDFTTIYFNHYLDFHWNIKDHIKWSNSIGVGMMAMTRGKARNEDVDIHELVMIDNDRPVILSFSYESQLTERYRRFDVGYFISFTPYGIPLFDEDADNNNGFDDRHKLSKIQFTSIGIRLLPHPKKKKPIDLVE